MDFLSACRQFIAIDSSQSHGTKELALFAAELCRGEGLEVQIEEEILGGAPQANLLARFPSTSNQRPGAEFMLQTHFDTAEAGLFQAWVHNSQNPFDSVISDGNLYGLGAADTKLDFLCKLEALKKFKSTSKWKLPPVLVGTFGEEQGMVGALKLIRKNLISAKMALIGEPTGLRLVRAAKGFANVEIYFPFSEDEKKYRSEHNLRESTSTQSKLFKGKPGHSASPELGESAVLKMFEFLRQLPAGLVAMEIDGGQSRNTVPSHAFSEIELAIVKDAVIPRLIAVYDKILSLQNEFLNFCDSDFQPPHPTLNIGMIRTQDDGIFISGCCRMPPSITQSIYENWMNQLRAVCETQKANFSIVDYKRPFRMHENSILVKGCLDELRAMSLNEQSTTQATTNESSLFSRVGIDCVCFGPGVRENNSHTPTEHVPVANLHKATEFYQRIIERFCL